MPISPSILKYSYFKVWPWKSLLKDMRVVKGQGGGGGGGWSMVTKLEKGFIRTYIDEPNFFVLGPLQTPEKLN